jgi:molybdopterin-containing oxidoreductase family iron-sulfur binding subunit
MNKNNPLQDSGMEIAERKFVMVIDLARCNNARRCVEACQKAHHLPPHQELMKVYLMQESEDAIPFWMPKPCFHCDHPMCVESCPEGATTKQPDGIVVIDKEKCKSCKLCLTVCPFSARLYNKSGIKAVSSEASIIPDRSEITGNSAVSKCDFCASKVADGGIPHCVTACESGVIYFGDKNLDLVSNGIETVSFSELIKSRGGYRHLEELGTLPSVYYLPPSNAVVK